MIYLVVDPMKKFKIQGQINNDNRVLEDLMDILSNMPRMVLLILKTNDLTRI